MQKQTISGSDRGGVRFLSKDLQNIAMDSLFKMINEDSSRYKKKDREEVFGPERSRNCINDSIWLHYNSLTMI